MAKSTFLPAKKPSYPGEGSPNRVDPPPNPRKYNEEVHAKIVEGVRDGNAYNTAGVLAGLGKDTIWTWIDHARKRPEKYPEYVQLLQDMEEARAQCHDEIVNRIKETALSGAPNTWQAGAWLLERHDPEQWGKRDKVEVTQNGSPTLQINQVILVDPEARERSRDLLRRFASPGSDVTIGPGVGSELEAGEGSTGSASESPIEVDALEVD